MEKPSRTFERPEATAGQKEAVFERCLRRVPDATENSVCVGVALPAPILTWNGPVFGPPSNSEWRWGRLDVGGLAGRRLDAPVLVDDAGAPREFLYGAGREALVLRELFAVSVSAAAMDREAGRKIPAEGGAS